MGDKNKKFTNKPGTRKTEETLRAYQAIFTPLLLDKIKKAKGQQSVDALLESYKNWYTGNQSNVSGYDIYTGAARDDKALNAFKDSAFNAVGDDYALTSEEMREGLDAFNTANNTNYNTDEYLSTMNNGILKGGMDASLGDNEDKFSRFGYRSMGYPTLLDITKKQVSNEFITPPNSALPEFKNPSYQPTDLSSPAESLEQKKLGGWMKKNASGIAGGAMILGGAALTLGTGGVGSPVGAGMMASGAGQIAGQVQQNNQADMAAQNADQNAAMMEQQNKAAYIQQKEQELFGQPQMPMMALGGEIPTNDYQGQSHEGPNGGIPVDQNGNPSVMSNQPAIGLVENGEVNLGSFIFSDKLKPSKGKQTFADAAKSIKNKYKVRLGKDLDGNDEYAKNSMTDELKALATSQEMLKAQEVQIPQIPQGMQFMNGGNLPKYVIGGDVDQPPKYYNTDPYNFANNLFGANVLDPPPNTFNAKNMSGITKMPNKGLTFTDQYNIINNSATLDWGTKNSDENLLFKDTPATPDLITKMPYRGLTFTDQDKQEMLRVPEWNPANTTNATNISATPDWATKNSDGNLVFKDTPGAFDPGSVAPAYIGAGASVLGNAAQLISSNAMAKELGKTADRNQIDAYTYTPEDVSFAKTREQTRARALDARREAMRTARGTGGQNYADLALSFLSESNKGLSDQLISSEQQEELANVGARNHAQQFNNQMLARTDQFNLQNKQMLEGQALGLKNQAVNNLINSVGTGVQHVAGAYQDANQFEKTAKFISENYTPITLPDGSISYQVKKKENG